MQPVLKHILGCGAGILFGNGTVWAAVQLPNTAQPIQESTLLAVTGVTLIACAGLLRSRLLTRLNLKSPRKTGRQEKYN